MLEIRGDDVVIDIGYKSEGVIKIDEWKEDGTDSQPPKAGDTVEVLLETVESEDGSFSSGATAELPEQWPSDIPEPDGLAIMSATVIGADGEQAITIRGTADGEDFVDSYGSALESAGFDEQSTFTSGDTINNVYSNDQWTIGVIYFGESSDSQVTVSVYSNS